MILQFPAVLTIHGDNSIVPRLPPLSDWASVNEMTSRVGAEVRGLQSGRQEKAVKNSLTASSNRAELQLLGEQLYLTGPPPDGLLGGWAILSEFDFALTITLRSRITNSDRQ